MCERRHLSLKVSQAWWINSGGSRPCVLHINNPSIAIRRRYNRAFHVWSVTEEAITDSPCDGIKEDEKKENQRVKDKVWDAYVSVLTCTYSDFMCTSDFIEKSQFIFSGAEIHIQTNNTTLDSLVSVTNATQSVLSSLWLCPQHLFLH